MICQLTKKIEEKFIAMVSQRNALSVKEAMDESRNLFCKSYDAQLRLFGIQPIFDKQEENKEDKKQEKQEEEPSLLQRWMTYASS